MEWDFINKKMSTIAIALSDQGMSEDEIIEHLTEKQKAIIKKLGTRFLKELKKNAVFSIREHEVNNKEFLSRLEFRWYKGFDLLDILINCCLELVEEVYIEMNSPGNNCSIKDDLLFRLHARAVRVAKEITVLIKNGFADGAMARWRSLFEICAVALFIDEHDDALAEKYLDYLDIENYKELIEYQKRCIDLGFKKIDDQEVERITKRKEELIKKYGKEFIEYYGWTFDVLPRGSRSITGIIENVHFELWKPYYKMACNSVHSGAKSLFFNLSISDGKDLLLVGPSNVGFTDPAQNTSISIFQITTMILLKVPTNIRFVVIESLNKLVSEIANTFQSIQENIDAEELSKQQ